VPDRAIEVVGLNDFRKELRNLGGRWPRELAKAHRDLAKSVASEARRFAVGTGPMQAHFAGRIYGTGSAQRASIAVRSDANAAFWGAKKHTGWYATKPGPPQFPEWVGNNWDVGVPGQGPLAINPTIFHEMDNITERYAELIDHLARRAFPD
jgi:hypothetical protein